MGPIGRPTVSVRNCQYSLRNNPQQRSSQRLVHYNNKENTEKNVRGAADEYYGRQS